MSTRLSDAYSQAPSRRYTTVTSQGQVDVSDETSISTVKGVTSNEEAASEKRGTLRFGLDADVEHGLFGSIAYLRADGRHSLSSLPSTSSVGSKYGWAFFSDFSLAQLSNLSVLSRPISCQELWNPEIYVVSNQINNPRDSDSLRHSIRDTTPASPASSLHPRRGSRNNLSSIFNSLLGGKNTVHYDTAEARRIRASINRKIELKNNTHDPRVKVLLTGQEPLPVYNRIKHCAEDFTGASEAGKSTLLKQMRLAYDEGFYANERLDYRDVVRSHLLAAFQMILEEFHYHKINFLNLTSYV